MGAIALHQVRRSKFLAEGGCVWKTSCSSFANRRVDVTGMRRAFDMLRLGQARSGA